jgi:uncharacterized protein (TIGR00730 family)
LAIYTQRARELGQALGVRRIDLVYGGGHVGLMGTLADSVLQAGGRVIGVIPQALVERELLHTGISETHIVSNMHQRKALMAELADAFITLPGGYGTVDETFEMLTWRQLKFSTKPIGLLNVEGFFDSLLAWIDRTINDGFLKPRYRDYLLVETSVDALLSKLSQAAA